MLFPFCVVVTLVVVILFVTTPVATTPFVTTIFVATTPVVTNMVVATIPYAATLVQLLLLQIPYHIHTLCPNSFATTLVSATPVTANPLPHSYPLSQFL
jgi:hypothetical protein